MIYILIYLIAVIIVLFVTLCLLGCGAKSDKDMKRPERKLEDEIDWYDEPPETRNNIDRFLE
jgi:hypothetical protein